jgi:hypothetical protein
LEGYIGRYRGLGIVLEIRQPESGSLEVVFNGREEIGPGAVQRRYVQLLAGGLR